MGSRDAFQSPLAKTPDATFNGDTFSYDMATRLVLPTAGVLDSGRRIKWISEEAGSGNDKKETLPDQHDRGLPHSLTNAHDAHHSDVQSTKPRNKIQDKENIPPLQTRPAAIRIPVLRVFGYTQSLRMGVHTVISAWNFAPAFSKYLSFIVFPHAKAMIPLRGQYCRRSDLSVSVTPSKLHSAFFGHYTEIAYWIRVMHQVRVPGVKSKLIQRCRWVGTNRIEVLGFYYRMIFPYLFEPSFARHLGPAYY
ncbi:hypothetical protein ARMGADRAFT_1057079 [Armillaria gallica]|uniref:Uncharacterized protein n=1 Tax=Armillaria gallica TaxID=47427 RepID=A0A2H3EDB7_ARMGA|nr:hypothetical protein ARMGADRAFT_1057079 [Armillaria gallica]